MSDKLGGHCAESYIGIYRLGGTVTLYAIYDCAESHIGTCRLGGTIYDSMYYT